MSDSILRAEVRLNPQGRIVIPVEFRRELGWQPGDELIMYVEDGALVMDTRANILRRVQDEFAKVPPN